MAKIYIAEYIGMAFDAQNGGLAIPPSPPTVEQKIDTAGTTGAIATLGAITAGSLYTNGTYTNVPLTGGTGSGAKATITVSGAAVTAVTLTARGTGYTAADSLSATAANIGGTGSGFAIPVSTIEIRAAAFQPTTRFAEVSADGICSILVGSDTSAVVTTSSKRLAANERVIIGVDGQNTSPQFLSAITNT